MLNWGNMIERKVYKPRNVTAVNKKKNRTTIALVELLNAWKANDFSVDFNLMENCQPYRDKSFQVLPDECQAEQVNRFDELSDLIGQAALYMNHFNVTEQKKGTQVIGLGNYSDFTTIAIIDVLELVDQIDGSTVQMKFNEGYTER